MSTGQDRSNLESSASQLNQLSDDEVLAITEVFGSQGNLGDGIPNLLDRKPGDSARRGLDLVRLAVAYLPESSQPQTLEEHSTWKDEANRGAGANSQVNHSAASTPVPARIGRFEVIRELGQGGFGVVLLARDPILQRLVALKIPKPEALISKSARSRFEREARAAAMLSHPTIVPLFETELHGPIQYIAFGFVPGESLGAFLSRQRPVRPDLAARIVARLAEAVEHAHQRGVVHRDLKPSNILLAYIPGDRLVSDEELVESLKIADFGLAKVTDSDSAGLTKDGSLLGTPSYMSPEQAQGREQEVGPASDTYGLGAVLYELLTGVPPFKKETDLATLRAVEHDPPTAPRALIRNISRDLQSICLKCLEKNPQHRYRSSSDLAADLNRWLAGEPIRARHVTPPERLWRWTVRNPALASSMLLTFLSLTIGLTVTLVQQQKLRDQLHTISGEKRRANLEADRAQKSEQATLAALLESQRQRKSAETHYLVSSSVRGFLYEDLLGQSDPQNQVEHLQRLRKLGYDEFEFAANPTINELLRRVLPKMRPDQLERRFPNQPIVQAELLSTIGSVLTEQDLDQEAVELLQRAQTILAGHPEASAKQIQDCEFRLALALSEMGRLDEASELRRRSLSAMETVQDVTPELITTQLQLASIDYQRGQIPKAIDECRRIVEVTREHFEPSHPIRRRAVNSLASIFVNSRRQAEAIQILEAQYPSLETLTDESDTAVIRAQSLLAIALLEAGEVARAKELLTKVHASYEELLGSEHPTTVRILLPLAEAQFLNGEVDEAIELNEFILECAGEFFGVNSSIVLAANNNLATIHWKRGQFHESVDLLEKVVRIAEQRYGATNLNTLFYQANLGVNYRDAGKFDEAIACLEKVAPQAKQFRRLQWTTKELANTYLKANRLDAAEAFCRNWISQVDPADASQLAAQVDSHGCLGRCLMRQKKYSEAERELKTCLDFNAQSQTPLSDEYWPIGLYRSALGICLIELGHPDEGATLLQMGCQQLRSKRDRVPKPFRPEIAALFQELIKYYESQSKTEFVNEWQKIAADWSGQ